ncbi:MAG: imelysin family protein [Saprospiraceae bacterium]
MQLLKIATIVGALSLFATACGKDDPTPTTTDYSANLSNIALHVITATYLDLNLRSAELVTSLSNLGQSPNAINLEAARQAWRTTRVPWEQSEGFLYGPVDVQGIDPSLDSWPVNQSDLDNVLASPAVLTDNYVRGLDPTLRGFHTIEYLLFGTDASKEVSDFSPRQFEYLLACGQVLQDDATRLYDGWAVNSDNFAKNFLQAGLAGSIYPSQKAALQETVNGMVAICDEVANGKINDPFSQQNLTLEESRFSNNSKADFADNIRSIQNCYLGRYGGTDGPGITDVVISKNANLDIKVRQEIEAAISAIENIPGTFTTAISQAPASVQNAQDKVRTLLDTLLGEVVPLISNL